MVTAASSWTASSPIAVDDSPLSSDWQCPKGLHGETLKDPPGFFSLDWTRMLRVLVLLGAASQGSIGSVSPSWTATARSMIS